MAANPGRCRSCTLFTAPHNATRNAHEASGRHDPVQYECPGCHGTACTARQFASHIPKCDAVKQMDLNREGDMQIGSKSSRVCSNNPLWADERRKRGIVLLNLPAIDDEDFREAYCVPDGADYANMTNHKRGLCKLTMKDRTQDASHEAEDTEYSLADDGGPDAFGGTQGGGTSLPAVPSYSNPHYCSTLTTPQPSPADAHFLLGDGQQTRFKDISSRTTISPTFPMYGNSHQPPGSGPQQPSRASQSFFFSDQQHGRFGDAMGDKTPMSTFPTHGISHFPPAVIPSQPSQAIPATLSGDEQQGILSGYQSPGPTHLPESVRSQSSPSFSTVRRQPTTGTVIGLPSGFIDFAFEFGGQPGPAGVSGAERDIAASFAPPGNAPLSFGGSPETTAYINALESARNPWRTPSPVEISEQQKADLRARLENQFGNQETG